MPEPAVRLHSITRSGNFCGESLAENIKDKIPFSDLFGELFSDRYNGPGRNARCPSHGEDKKPSFQVNETYGFCHTCQWNGSVIDLWMLHYGCDEKQAIHELAARLGLKSEKRAPSEKPQIEACYDYLDENGEGLYQVRKLRYSNGKKDFRQIAYTAFGGFKTTLDDTRRVLYRLPNIINNQDSVVVIVEGEKDVATAEELGYVATTVAGSHGGWGTLVKHEGHLPLKDRDVWFIPDNDKIGEKFVKSGINAIADIVSSIKIIRLAAELPDKSDISDYVKKFGQDKARDEIEKLQRKAKTENLTQPQFELESGKGFKPHIWVEALRIKHSILFYDDRFYVYDDGYYQLLKDEFKLNTLIDRLGGEELRKREYQEIAYKLSNKLTDIQGEKEVNSLWNLNLNNCWLDLHHASDEDGLGWHEHGPELLSTFKIPIDFDIEAKCPTFNNFISQQFPEEELQKLIWEMLGYLLVPSSKFQVGFFIKGPPASGKSKLIEVIEALLGKDRVSNVPIEDFADRFSLSLLDQKLCNVCGETDIRGKVSDRVLKQLIAGDTIKIEEKFKQGRSVKPTARVLVASNAFPRAADTSEAFFRRWIVIPANITVAEKDRDYDLGDKFKGEMQGILFGALSGLRNLLKNNKFTKSKASEECKIEWREEVNLIEYWISNCLTPSKGGLIEWVELCDHCNSFLVKDGLKAQYSRRNFNKEMFKLGYNRHRKSNTYYLDGYKLG